MAIPGELGHFIEHIGMKVEGDGDGGPRADHAADFPQELAVAVLIRFRDHRSMQGDKDPVVGATRPQPRQGFLGDLPASGLGDRATGLRMRGKDVIRLPATGLGDVDRTADFRPGVAEVFGHVLAQIILRRVEILDLGQEPGEGVTFANKPDDGNAEAHIVSFPDCATDGAGREKTDPAPKRQGAGGEKVRWKTNASGGSPGEPKGRPVRRDKARPGRRVR